MDEFCGSPFWDIDLTWNTEKTKAAPDLTPCFQNTVLVWIPCLFFWVFFTINFVWSSSSRLILELVEHVDEDKDKDKVEKKFSEKLKEGSSGGEGKSGQRSTSRSITSSRNIPWNALNVSKSVICVVLVITQIIRLGNTLTLKLSNFIIHPVDTVTPVLKISTYALVLASIVISKKKGIRTSAIQFAFWFLLAAFQLFKFRTTILALYKDEAGTIDHRSMADSLTHILELIDYPLIIGQFLLHCWADFHFSTNVTLENSATRRECPQKSASTLSYFLFAWFDSLAWKGYQKSLETKDLWELNPEDKARNVSSIFEKIWKSKYAKIKSSQNHHQYTRPQVGVLSVLFGAFGKTFLAGSALKLIPDLLAFASPQILNALITFISSDEDMWKGYFYAVLLCLATVVLSWTETHYNHVMYTTEMRVKSALVSVIYKKSLVVSNAAKKETNTGEIVNLMSVDIQNLQTLIPYVNYIWSSPLQISLSLYFLWGLLGPSVLAGVGVMFILIVINSVMRKFLRTFQIKQMKNKDERVKLTSEIISGIKILKFYAWEPSFQEEIMKLRRKEIKILKDAACLNIFGAFLWNCSGFMVGIGTLATYVLLDEKNVLDAQTVFVSLTLLNFMTGPMTFVPMVISMAIQASVSLGRLNKFMNAEEIDTSSISHDEAEKNPIVIENGYFSWDHQSDRHGTHANEKTGERSNVQSPDCGYRDPCVLKDITMSVQEGSLVAVVGSVGSGKSSLLCAILGELEKTSGRVNTRGSISYVAQQTFILSDSLQENILFGKPFEALKYNKIIDACALGPDLDILPGRDEVEIGEKGINLSGGQKQRVSIARAVYNNSDLYLLDDPLSAVDSQVGKHIFKNVISSTGLLGRKTRVIVTSALHLLPHVDHIIVMKNGKISESGTYDQLLRQKGECFNLISQYTQTETDMKIQSEFISRQNRREELLIRSVEFRRIKSFNKDKSDGNEVQGREKHKKLISEEVVETQSVKWSIYFDYFRAAGWGRVILAALMYIEYKGFAIGSHLWLNVWSSEPIVNGTQGNRDLYLGVYGCLGAAQSLSFMIATALLCFAVIFSASVFHLKMLKRILRAPMSFFDTTPSGRIINRFSKDVNILDNTLSYFFQQWINMFINVLGALIIITYSTPIFVLVLIPVCIFYFFVQRFFVPTYRQLKRLEAVTRSPVYSHFTETLNGASTIRAYGQQQRFISESEIKLDENMACYYPSLISSRWLEIRLEGAGSLMIFFAALFAVLSRDSLKPGLVGLTISYALENTYFLGYLVRAGCDLEANIVAVERLKEYSQVPQEAPWKSSLRKPPTTWPAYGSIEFNNYETRYRDGMDLVLKNTTCSIKPGEKIGVVGRTGAGKSSLTLALFRIIEGVGRGSITIDGEDIQKLGLHDVRSRLTIIPQDPILFSGTLRFNLDPFSKFSDNAVWRALELCQLKPFVEGLQGGLEFKVSEGGDNLSVGQKQLVCLSRAVLKKSKVLVLDEATAAMDLETDDLIQKTIRSEFKDSTVITIAHRLITIMDSTRVMVINKGTIREFDTPAKLLANTESEFYVMASEAGVIPNNI